MARSRSMLLGTALLLAAAGCGSAPVARGSSAPSASPAGTAGNAAAVSATCPAAPPQAPTHGDETAGSAPLVPTSPEPVLLTLCTYQPDASAPAHGGESREIVWSGPEAREIRGPQVADTVAELNALAAVTDTSQRACTLVLMAAHRLLVTYADGTTVVLDADENCDLVSDGKGAVRDGVTPIVLGLRPA